MYVCDRAISERVPGGKEVNLQLIAWQILVYVVTGYIEEHWSSQNSAGVRRLQSRTTWNQDTLTQALSILILKLNFAEAKVSLPKRRRFRSRFVRTLPVLVRLTVPRVLRGDSEWDWIVVHLANSVVVPGEFDLVCLCHLATTNRTTSRRLSLPCRSMYSVK
jgi:hypothetical protein